MPKTSQRSKMTRATDPDAIRLGRLERGMSQRDVADALHRKYKVTVDGGQVSRIENGITHKPNPKLLHALCDFFGLPITYFDTDPPH